MAARPPDRAAEHHPAELAGALGFPTLWKRYRRHLLIERRAATNTVITYRKHLHEFERFLRPKPWQRATIRDLERFLSRPSTSTTSGYLAANSQRLEAVAVCGLYRWAHRQRYTSSDRMGAFTPPKGGQPVSRALPIPDVGTILAAAAGDERLELMAWLAYGAGLRVSEIAAARIEDVTLRGDHPMLVVPDGKGGKARVVPLASPLAAVLAAYLARRPGAGPLVTSTRYPARPLTPHTVSSYLSAHMHGLGIQESAHALRHTFATELLRAGKGANLYAVSRLLGHAGTAITERVYVSDYAGEAQETVELLPDPRRSRSPQKQ